MQVNSGKILLLTGYPWSAGMTSEVIDLESTSTTCQVWDASPVQVEDAAGGLLLQKWPIICGGWDGSDFTDSCRILGSSVQLLMLAKRARGASIVTGNLEDTLFVTGGTNKEK